jgi:predicted nucleic acid-binding protein
VLARLLQSGLPLVEDFWSSVSSSDDELVGAELLRSECTSIIRKAVFDRWISQDQGSRLVQELIELPVRVVSSPQQFSRALDLAARFQHKKAYDMQYLAVAELERAELMTIDRGLRHAAHEVGVPVQYLR